jgi:putative autotransporter adhesin-like protein
MCGTFFIFAILPEDVMKIHSLLLIIIVNLLILTGCSNPSFYQATVQENLVKENWYQHVNVSPSNWTRNADPWFLTGEPNQLEHYLNNPSHNLGSAITQVRAGRFNNLVVNGSFQVQIVGGQAKESVYVLGPYNAIRQISIQNKNHTLYINQMQDPKANLKKVIVRIGVCQLKKITNLGKGDIYGRQITSDCLAITACDCGSVVLTGQMNLNKIMQLGTGSVTVIGAYTPCLFIKVKGNGNVNVSGRVGVQKIANLGNGCINIIGADSDSLTIHANGKGSTSVVGCVNLKKVTASDYSSVYVYCINSKSLYVSQSGCSHVGLAGYVGYMNIDMMDSSRFEGQYLHGGSIYVLTRDWSHANVAPDVKIFAAAKNKSSIYLFGSPNIVSRYPNGGGVILPVFNDSITPHLGPACMLPTPPTWVPERTYKQ